MGFGAFASKPSPRTNTGVLGYRHGCLRPIRGRRAGGSGWSPGISTFCRMFWSTNFFLSQLLVDKINFIDPCLSPIRPASLCGYSCQGLYGPPFLGPSGTEHPSLNHVLAWHTRPPCVKWCACAGASFHKNALKYCPLIVFCKTRSHYAVWCSMWPGDS